MKILTKIDIRSKILGD